MSTPYLEPIKTTVVLTGKFMNEFVCSNNKNTVKALLATTCKRQALVTTTLVEPCFNCDLEETLS